MTLTTIVELVFVSASAKLIVRNLRGGYKLTVKLMQAKDRMARRVARAVAFE